MNKSEQINELAKALSLAQAEITGAMKDSINPHFKSSYADLAAIWDAVRAPLTKHGLSVTQCVRTIFVQEKNDEAAVLQSDSDCNEDGKVRYLRTNGAKSFDILHTYLFHTSGQWVESSYPIRPTKTDPQSFAAAVTYARRYSLAAITGCPSIDDDGNTASGHHTHDVPPKATSKKDNQTVYNEVKFVLEASGYEVIDRDKFKAAVDKFIETSSNPSEHKTIAIFLGHCPFVKIRPAIGGRMP